MSIDHALPHPNALSKLHEFHHSPTVNFSKPHGIYNISYEHLLADNNLSRAVLVAWRFFRIDEDGHLGVDEVRIGENKNEHFYSGFHKGPTMQEHSDMIDECDAMPELSRYEHNFLRMSSLRINALWFKSKSDLPDYFYPLEPRFHDFDKRLYTQDEFMLLLTAAVKERLKLADVNSDPLLGG